MLSADVSCSRSVNLLRTLSPPSASRAWFSAPHPYLPIVATTSSDKTVRIYSLTSFHLVSNITGGHKRSIRTCAWKPNSKGESVLATGSFDASAGIWRRYDNAEAGDGPREQDFTRGTGHENEDEEEQEDWTFAVVLDGHESEIKSVAWSASGQFLATCSRDKSVWIWEELGDDNFETIAVLQEHDADVKCVAWHPQEDLLVSSSYDDTIRMYREDIDDWGIVARLDGHEATVWCVDFEGVGHPGLRDADNEKESQPGKRTSYLEALERAGPRLISSSDDLTIRIWRRKPRERSEPPTGQGRIPSIIKTNSIEEDWFEEARLPQVHDRAIYSVNWSKRTGLVVSTGSDGKIIVYKEEWRSGLGHQTEGLKNGANGHESSGVSSTPSEVTTWTVVACSEAGHDVFEINHVCWATRLDKDRRSDDEETIITTGDDGEVKIWTLD